MNQEKILNQFKNIAILFTNKGCNKKTTLSFIHNNLEYLTANYNKITDNLYCIYNHHDLYGILIVFGNNYDWAIYENEELGKIMSSKNQDNYDYIIDTILEATNSQKFTEIIPELPKMNIENKIKILNKIGLNSSGYHFK